MADVPDSRSLRCSTMVSSEEEGTVEFEHRAQLNAQETMQNAIEHTSVRGFGGAAGIDQGQECLSEKELHRPSVGGNGVPEITDPARRTARCGRIAPAVRLRGILKPVHCNEARPSNLAKAELSPDGKCDLAESVCAESSKIKGRTSQNTMPQRLPEGPSLEESGFDLDAFLSNIEKNIDVFEDAADKHLAKQLADFSLENFDMGSALVESD